MNWKNRCKPVALFLLGMTALSSIASAQVIKEPNDSLDSLAFISERLQANTVIEPLEDAQATLTPEVSNGWASFRMSAGGEWKALIDKRTGRIEIVEGSGLPWVPGRGNSLTGNGLASRPGEAGTVDLARIESLARGFLPQVESLLGVKGSDLVLNKGRSGQPAEHLWFADFDLVLGGLPVEGARVVFRVSNGNLVQFGSENLPSPNMTMPSARVSQNQALDILAGFIGGIQPGDDFLDKGSLRLLPAAVANAGFADGFAFGGGRGLVTVWQLTFRRAGENATWRARVDAQTGEMLELLDTNHYAQATGGARILGTSTNLPMPYTNLSSGGFTNSAGVYNFGGGAVTSSLAGQYVRITDNCGAISLAATAGTGDLTFGTSASNNCTTPGFGGAGNTHAARTQFYHLNRAKDQARGWLPGNAWVNAQLTANVNINLTCNAFWNGSTVNFYRSGGGCGNTGEIEGVALHEYGHGLDSNDGNGSAPDNGTGETYGDFTAALGTHTSCVGSGFLTANCGGYGDACTSCTGVRDIDWAKHVSNTPHTVSNFTQARCPTSATYRGPCGREGHCESYISSEALWDFANRDLPNPGTGAAWTIADRLWYLSRSTATAAFACTASGTWSSNGCNAGSLWKTMRLVDDDDGNLANGTPHGGALYAAFNRHGIACTTDAGASISFAGCTPPATPTLSLTAGNNQVGVSFTGSTGVYDVYRNELGCNSGFVKVANNVAATSFNDTAVANGFTYYYLVFAHPSATEACSGAPTTCLSVTPAPVACTPPAAPTGLSAVLAGTSANLSWPASAGATSYNIYRSTTPGGPYTQVGTSATTTFTNTGLACNTTYYYVVRATNAPTCESGNSNQASVTTAVCPPCTTTTLYTRGFESPATGMDGWTKGTFLAGGSTASWRGIQTCTARAGTKVFRFGGTSCTADYGSNNFTFAQPNGAAGITIPAGSSVSRLSFWHRRAFESGYDGGALTVSLDGTNYTFVPASAIISGTSYNGTVAPDCAPAGAAGTPIFTGTAAAFVNTTVNLDAACNAVTGGTGGCAGQAVRIGFTGISDCSVTGDGWFLDDVVVTSCTP